MRYSLPNDPTSCKDTGFWPFGGIALSGVYWHKDPTSQSGYDTRVESRLHELAEGGIFVDKRPVAEDDRFVGWVLNDPMVDTRLAKGQVEACPLPSEVVLSGLEGAFKTYALARVEGWKGLDTVSVSEHCAVWMARGALIGVRLGDNILWSNGTTAPIAPCECWRGTCFQCGRNRYYVDRVPTKSGIVKVRDVTGPDDHCPECKQQEAAA